MGKLGFFHWVVDQLAKSGLILRGDPPKVIQLEGREWGPEAGGWALSIAGRRDVLSVILRNTTDAQREMAATGWLHFFEVRITAPDGAPARPTAYGRTALDASRGGTRVDRQLGAGQAVELELPIGVLFEMSAPGRYTVVVRCPALGLESNAAIVER